MHPLYEMIEGVTDEQSFVRFLKALREDCEAHERDCPKHDRLHCAENQHFEAHSTCDFLKSMADWSTGDFADGLHGGAPILQRVAAMLWVGRFHWPESRD